MHIPTLNALLNGLSALCLLGGWLAIRKKQTSRHRAWMLSALCSSILFLFFYLTYHAKHGSTPFTGGGLARVFYFTVLISHSLLAALNVPLVTLTLIKIFRGDIDRHRRLARITFPIWFYVSVTGVVIYWMLYKSTF